MIIVKSTFLALLASVATSHALPPNPAAVVCSDIKHQLGYRAAAVCSSYLGPPPTTTITRTATTVHTNLQTVTLPVQTQLTTVQVATTILITSEATQYLANPTQTQLQTVIGTTKTIYRYSGASKRGAINPVLCGLERKYSKQLVTAGCNCVCNPTAKTVTRTVTVTQQTTQKLTIGPAETVLVTDTQYVPVTQEIDITATFGPTGTDTVLSMTTVNPILVKPAICNARGLPGPNAFNYDANFNTNQNACIASCKTDNRCLATGFYIVTDPSSGTQTGTCRKYDKSVTDSADLGFGYYNFNDKDCPGS